jgi:DNA-binding transcriptional regulator/RsmH inhibitor MraZ
MLLPADDDMLIKGLCKGHYEATVDYGPRIRLPTPIINSLEKEGIKQIVVFPDPYGCRLIICPDKFYDQYVKMVIGDRNISLKPDKAYRRLICAAEPIALRKPCRIQLKVKFNEKLGIKAGDGVVIVRVSYWFEIWRKDDWERDNDNKS